MNPRHCTLITALILSIVTTVSAQPAADGSSVSQRNSISATGDAANANKSGTQGKKKNADLYLADEETRWGVRTNFLYDANAIVNLGIETNVSNKWGLTCDLFFPWWNKWDNSRTTEVLAGSLEARYYWRSWTTSLRVLNGPFVGVHAAGGIYDICRNNKGSQGDWFAAVGGVIGYSVFIDKWWRLDLSAGVGYMTTQYEHYHVIDEKYLYRHYKGNYSYVGPTKLEMSVVWLFSQCWQDKR